MNNFIQLSINIIDNKLYLKNRNSSKIKLYNVHCYPSYDGGFGFSYLFCSFLYDN